MGERAAIEPDLAAAPPVATEPSVPTTPRVATPAPAESDWIADLAAGLHRATRATVRLRPDGLVEVIVAEVVIGFVDHVAPVFVALAGARPAIAVEVAQCATLAAAVDVVRAEADARP